MRHTCSMTVYSTLTVRYCKRKHLQHDGQLLGRLLVLAAMVQPQLKGSQLLAEEGAGLEVPVLIRIEQPGRMQYGSPRS